MADPAQPVEVGYFPSTHYACYVCARSPYAYLANLESLVVLDMRDPAEPRAVGGCPLEQVINDMTPVGDYLYLAMSRAGIVLIDVSDPAHPFEAGRYHSPDSLWTMAVSVVGSLAYVVGNRGLEIVDVSEPLTPHRIGACSITGLFGRDVVVCGQFAYVAEYSAGLGVIDVSDPAHPLEVRVESMPRDQSALALVNDRIVASDGGRITVFDISDPVRPREVGASDRRGASALAVAAPYFYGAYVGLQIYELLPGGIKQFASTPREATRVRLLENPVQGRNLRLAFDGAQPEEVTVEIYNVAGREVAEFARVPVRSGNATVVLPKGGLSAGAYFLEVSSPGKTTRLKVVVTDY